MPQLRYSIDLQDRSKGEIRVSLELPPARTWRLRLPRWTPGSYVFRDYARHLMDLQSDSAEVFRPDPHHVELRSDGSAPVVLHYRVYARELTVRTAFVTDDWAFWNGACVYLWPTEGKEFGAEVEILEVAGEASEAAFSGHGEVAQADGRWILRLADHDDAVDTPVLVGGRPALEVRVAGTPIRFVEAGSEGLVQWSALEEPVAAALGEAVAVFGGELPVQAYHFLSLFGETGRGGLEHMDSSTLLASRTFQESRREVQDFIGLIAHEFFHVWNVKRMRPRELWDIDFQNENPTRLLWVAEGFTAYYDDLCCARAGAFTHEHYFERLTEHVNGRWADTPLGEASLEAWTKLYKGGENLRNNSVNYYVDGALAGLVLDVAIRRGSGDRHDLDDFMRTLYRRTYVSGRGYDLDDVVAVAEELGGAECGDLARRLDTDPVRPMVGSSLSEFGLRLELRRYPQRLGVRLRQGSMEIASVDRTGAAWAAGFRSADEILAINGFRVRGDGWRRVLDRVAGNGGTVDLLIAREGVIQTRRVEIPAATDTPPEWRIEIDESASAEAVARRDDWLRARRPPD